MRLRIQTLNPQRATAGDRQTAELLAETEWGIPRTCARFWATLYFKKLKFKWKASEKQRKLLIDLQDEDLHLRPAGVLMGWVTAEQTPGSQVEVGDTEVD